MRGHGRRGSVCEEDIVADGSGYGSGVFAWARVFDPRDGAKTVDLAQHGAPSHLDDELDRTIGVGGLPGREPTAPACMKEDAGPADIDGCPTPPLVVPIQAIPDDEAELEPCGAGPLVR